MDALRVVVGFGLIFLVIVVALFLGRVVAQWLAGLGVFQRLGVYLLASAAATAAMPGFGSSAAQWAFLGWWLAIWLFAGWMMKKAGGGYNAGHIRGNYLASVKDVQRMVRGEESRFNIGEIPFPKRLEGRHLGLFGTTGAGKTRVLHGILQPSRETDARAIIVDIGGVMASRYYRTGDVILNPMDARSVPWSPLAEIQDETDVPNLAKAIIPDIDGPGGEWNRYAQRILTGVMLRLWESGTGTNAELIRLLTSASYAELKTLLAGHPAEGMFQPGNEKMLGSVMSIIASYITPLQSLPGDAGFDAWSVTRWVEATDNKSWLFMNFSDKQIESLKAIVTAVLGTAISALLTLSEDENRRLFMVIDEFDALGPISGIKALLTRGRRYGGAAIIAMQSVSQSQENYGVKGSQTLLSCVSTQLIMRLPDPETSEWASKLLGDREIEREMESTSHQSMQVQITTSNSTQYSMQRVVLPSEIQNMPDLNGLLNLAGDVPTCRVTIPPTNPPEVAPCFVKRERSKRLMQSADPAAEAA
jgi:type IV secretory pathway TraG/TraD family ATPase VirD4